MKSFFFVLFFNWDQLNIWAKAVCFYKIYDGVKPSFKNERAEKKKKTNGRIRHFYSKLVDFRKTDSNTCILRATTTEKFKPFIIYFPWINAAAYLAPIWPLTTIGFIQNKQIDTCMTYSWDLELSSTKKKDLGLSY